MSKVDKIKEAIGYMKVLLALAVGAVFALLGWFAQNYKTAELAIVIISLIVAILLTVFVVIVNHKINKKIDELEDL